jgi:hypothetical protein
MSSAVLLTRAPGSRGEEETMNFERFNEIAEKAVKERRLSIKEANEAGVGIGYACRELVIDNLGRVWVHYLPSEGDYRITSTRYGTSPRSCAFEKALLAHVQRGQSVVIELTGRCK